MAGVRLVDRAWPALPLALVALTALVAVVGVLAAPEPTETERIADVVEDFGAAVQERRGADACALLTPGARAQQAARLGTLDCAATVGSFGTGVNGGQLRLARVISARISGDRATIARDQLRVPNGEPFGSTVELERVAGEWRIVSVA